MNPPAILPLSFDEARHERIARLVALIPGITIDRTQGQFFSRPFTEKDIEDAKTQIAKHAATSAQGPDRVSYVDIGMIPNDELVRLFRACVEARESPSAWLLAKIVGILKHHKPGDDPDSYRIIGLESDLLKTLTLLAAICLRAWMAKNDIIPQSQNSVGGPIFDWLRKVCSTLRYRVSLEDELSDEFCSLTGILAGDSASPDLWNAFLGNFRPPKHKDDIILDGTAIGNLEHADDMVLVSTSPEGMQLKLQCLENYSRENYILVNVSKTFMMLDGACPATVNSSTFTLNGTPIKWTDNYTYVGVTFASGHRNIFALHYEKKAAKAKSVAGSIFSVESFVGSLPPLQGLRLYNARVDSHLPAACKVAIDVAMPLLKPLQAVQHTFLQRLIGLNPRAMRAFLFSESGLLPLAYRRIILALRYLLYLLSLPSHHLAACAWKDSQQLFYGGKACWLGDLAIVIQKIPFKKPIFNPLDVDPESVKALIDEVALATAEHVDEALRNSSKARLLCGRKHQNEDGVLEHRALALRPYLLVPEPKHRKALVALLLADHTLAEVRLRYHPQ
ncbi:hypothetical protein HWV62_3128 [Athelia sp. TMB]|nr:hypothetical protein HWV62_3128 [Athelia sp. TMB]